MVAQRAGQTGRARLAGQPGLSSGRPSPNLTPLTSNLQPPTSNLRPLIPDPESLIPVPQSPYTVYFSGVLRMGSSRTRIFVAA